MTKAQFLKLMLGSALVSVLVHFALGLMWPVRQYTDFLGWSILFFSVLALVAYIMGELSIKKRGGAGYIGLVMLSVFVKLLASFLFVALYVKYKTPEDRYFLLPFLVTYLIYTIYEVYFMSIQARESK